LHEPNYMCPGFNRILEYCDRLTCRHLSDKTTLNELEKIRREVERLRSRVENLREWGHNNKHKRQYTHKPELTVELPGETVERFLALEEASERGQHVR
jgi:hypothetical protein